MFARYDGIETQSAGTNNDADAPLSGDAIEWAEFTPETVYELSNRDIMVWREEGRAICLKVHNRYGDPVDMSEDEALELAALLTSLARKNRG